MSNLRELEWNAGLSRSQTVIYDNGHIDPEKSLALVREAAWMDTDEGCLAALTVADVKHTRFRPMSPSEAKSRGYDTGVMLVGEGESYRGYPVTMVEV